MRSDSQQSDRRRRGGRRHSRSPRSDSASSVTSREPAKKQGFFQRLLAFFTGKKPVAKSAARAAAPSRSRITVEPTKAPTETRTVRKPELVEVTSPKVYVGNLSFDAVESDLFELFAGVGSVQNAEVVSHRETQKSKGFAFVTMASVDEAKRAVTELHDKEFMGRRLVISGAKTSDVRDSR